MRLIALTKEEIQDFYINESTYIFETSFTVRQLTQARKWHNNENWMDKFHSFKNNR
mgnify:CR=1 FL=1